MYKILYIIMNSLLPLESEIPAYLCVGNDVLYWGDDVEQTGGSGQLEGSSSPYIFRGAVASETRLPNNKMRTDLENSVFQQIGGEGLLYFCQFTSLGYFVCGDGPTGGAYMTPDRSFFYHVWFEGERANISGYIIRGSCSEIPSR